MHTDHVAAALDRALEGRRLLEHPFYRRWEAGQLAAGELATYAEQYRHVERALPEVLATIADGLPAGRARELVVENLRDEQSVPAAHVELLESFASAAGSLAEAPAGAAVAALVAQERASAADPLSALALLAAYEVQAGAIARSKADGLRAHYGFDDTGCRFWDVHAAMESEHADWSIEALATLTDDEEGVFTAARRGADAWWAFLDEREAEAPALV
jgi:pyrroloquinoline-quinone synthase